MTTDAAADGTPRATLLMSGRPAIDLITPVTIGRDPRHGEGEVVVVDGDQRVSKAHLWIDCGADGFVVIDLGSSNGTFLHHLGQQRAVPTDSWTPHAPGAPVSVDLCGSCDSSGGRRKLVVSIAAALVAVVAIGVVVAMASGGDDDDGASVVTYSRIDADTYDLPAVTYDFLVYNSSGDESTTDLVPSNG